MSNQWRGWGSTALALCAVAVVVGTGCNGGAGESPLTLAANEVASESNPQLPSTPTPIPTPSSAPVPTYATAVLMYQGAGVSTSDAQTLGAIMTAAGISYRAVTSAQLNIMTAEQFATYGMILVPGGVASTMSNSLTSQTLQLIHDAVTEQGLGYFGICAGAFLAGDYGSWGLGLSSEAFDYYVAEYQGIEREMVDVSFPDGSLRQLVWYGGPKLDGFGDTLGTYSNGTIAVAQSEVGKGFVTLSAVHPEAPSSWRTASMQAADLDGVAADQAYALGLIRSTLTRSAQPTF
jgi:glutamine amidotransferase-like uncharacterized protein